MNYGRRKTDWGMYQSNEILSRPPEALVVLLYQRLLVELQRADRQIGAGELEGKAVSLSKASSILFELMGSLNHEVGGEIAGRLAALYSYFVREIHEVDRSLDRKRLQRLVEVITPLHESWSRAAQQSVGGAPVAGSNTAPANP